MLDTLSNKELKNIKLITLDDKQTLFNEGDFCDHIGIIKSGTIKISSYSETGKEIIYNVLKANDIFGNNLIFSNDRSYMGNVVATEKSEIYLIDKETLLSLLKNNSAFLVSYLSKQANATKELNFTLRLLSFDNAKERFLYYLETHNNEITFDSISSLSASLHLTRETTSRTISYLVNKKLIIKNKNSIKATKK